jgi:UDP-N-acetylmuramyl tripeptide synthase
MLRAAGLHAGLSSTDWVASADEVMERGDFSGPGGARTVLRANRVEAAVLETARGGMLRRGLAVRHADAAVITNVAADHLGEFGVETVAQLLDVKWIVTQACDQHSRLVLNADDASLAARGRDAPLNIVWFSLDSEHPLLENAEDKCTVENGTVVLYENNTRHELLPVADIPVTLGGAAVHNISNVLAAVGLTAAMGIAPSAMVSGLAAMSSQDNPGRCNQFDVNGARVLVDFAHNPHGVNAFLDIARNAPGMRQLLVIGQAGDRRDEDIRELAQAAATISLNRIIVKELNQYARGRPPGETAEILCEEFVHRGIEPNRISVVENELDAVRAAIDWAQPGDLLMLLIHEDRDAVLAYLQTLSRVG